MELTDPRVQLAWVAVKVKPDYFVNIYVRSMIYI